MKKLIVGSLCIALSGITLVGCSPLPEQSVEQIDPDEQAKRDFVDGFLQDRAIIQYARLDNSDLGDLLLVARSTHDEPHYTSEQRVVFYKYDKEAHNYVPIDGFWQHIGIGGGSVRSGMAVDSDNNLYLSAFNFFGHEVYKLTCTDGKYEFTQIYEGNLGDEDSPLQTMNSSPISWQPNIRTADKVKPQEISEKESQGYKVVKGTLIDISENKLNSLISGEPEQPEKSEYPVTELVFVPDADADIPQQYKLNNAKANVLYPENKMKSFDIRNLRYGPENLLDGKVVYIAFKPQEHPINENVLKTNLPLIKDFVIL